jgi:hypothetical protein
MHFEFEEYNIDIGPFFGPEGVATGILACARGPFFLGPSTRANILPSTPEGPKIRANDIVILILYAQGQIQRASMLSIVTFFLHHGKQKQQHGQKLTL